MTKAMQANSVAMLDEYVRKVENHLEALEDACATIGGQAKTMERKSKEFQVLADQLDGQVNQLLVAKRDDLAAAALAKAKAAKRTADQYKGQWKAAQGHYEQLLGVRTKLQAKLAIVKQEREELLALLELARAKEISVKTINSLDSLESLGDPDITKIADNIRSRLYKAEAGLEIKATDLDAQMEEILGTSRDQAELAERKKKLGISE